MAPNADGENGPAARSFAADAHDCIMVRIQTEPAVYKFGGARLRPNGELPSDPQQTRYRQTPKLCKKPLSQFIIPPRAQASKPAPGLNRGRCETQAPLSGKPPSFAKRFGPLTPSARSGNLVAGDRTKNGLPAPNKELSAKQKTTTSQESPIQELSMPLTVTGVAFFDVLHGQEGVAPNGIELHPILMIDFHIK